MNNQFCKCELLKEWLGTPSGKIVYLSKFKAAEMAHRGICKVYEEDQKNESKVDLEEVNEENNPQGEEVNSKSVGRPPKNKMIESAPKNKSEFK